MVHEDYQRMLEALRDDVVSLGEAVARRLETVLETFETEGTNDASNVASADAEINERYLTIEERCIDIFALRQPVASDLRFVVASFKILTDLERIADLAVNLAQYAAPDDGSLFTDLNLTDLGFVTLDMVERAISAYESNDADACFEIAARDDDLDGMCEQVTGRIVRKLATATDVGDAEGLLAESNSLLLTVRDLERIGDHAVNIAARTLYMVESDDALIF